MPKKQANLERAWLLPRDRENLPHCAHEESRRHSDSLTEKEGRREGGMEAQKAREGEGSTKTESSFQLWTPKL